MTQPMVTSGSDDDLDAALAEREDQDDDADVDNDTGDGEDDLADFESFTPEDYKKLLSKLSRTRREAKKLRITNRKLREGEEVEDDEAAREKKRTQELGKWQQRAVRSGARAALVEKGADSELLDLLVAKIDYGEIEFDDEDEPILDDWLDEMQERYPKAFTLSTPRRRVPSVNQNATQDGRQQKKKELSYGERVLQASAKVYGRKPPRPRR